MELEHGHHTPPPQCSWTDEATCCLLSAQCFLDRNSRLVVGLCVIAYIYGVAYAFFPYYFDNFKYEFKNVRSNCDFVLDAEGDNAEEIGSLYFALMGPIPMFLSLLLIIVTNSVIVIYIMKRYKSSWNRKKSRKSRKQGSFGSFIINMDQKVQSKQVIVSLLMMTGWYMMCYSIIIFCNFKNFFSYWRAY
ncbi:uncharacterized protein LOC134824609 [Bolinopsis microptera]|uniref:uncharacterized protein LOC134824609 n=1 Tax=Bolinopsis microptera TaxID=2820187 RepID=UPI003079E0BD